MPEDPKPSRKRLGTIKTEPEDSNRLGSLQSPVRAAPQSDPSGGASTSGRGATAGGRGGGRKVKFAPKVPARRKAAQAAEADGAASTSGAAENEAFKDLIKAAKSEASWAKGGRGRGRGRGDGERHHYQTVFGGGGPQHNFAQASGSGGGGTSGSGGGSKSWTRDGQPGSSAGAAAGKANLTPGELELLQAEGKAQREPEVTLNYEQYYPTLLPMRQPGMEETDAEAHARDDRPPDLSLHQEGVTNAAADLGLLDLDADPDRLLLLQLPSVLPVPASSLPPSRQQGQPIKSFSQPQACSLNQLPSGKIGKLLVFESGAVKLQMGGVLMDVTAGTPCQFRQEVAAVNAKDAHFIFLGDVSQRIVCSPNIEQLINDEPIPDWPRAPQQPAVGFKQPAKAKLPGKVASADGDAHDDIKDEDIMETDIQVKEEDELVNDTLSPSNRNAALMDEDESD